MRNLIPTVVVMIFFLANLTIAYGEIMPEDLVEFAKERGCSEVSDFYKDRPGMLRPPYIYGYMPGPEENSAVFWCQKRENNKRQFFLLVMLKNRNNELAKCPDKIEWSNYPGGLAIYRDKGSTLEGFVYLNNRSKKGPREKLTNNAILSEYDGVEVTFYCHKGQWLIRQRH